MPAKNEEYSHNIPWLNKVFAVSSIALLLGTIWMVWDDYARPWKRVQRQFRAIAAEKAEESLRQAEQSLDKAEMEKIRKDLQAAEAESARQRKDHADLQAGIVRADKEAFVTDRDFKNTKSVYDAKRFQYEELAHAQSSRAAAELDRLREVEARLAGYRIANEAALARLAALKQEEAAFTGKTAALEKERKDKLAQVERLQKKLATVEPQGLLLRTFQWVRNAPLLDFMAPNLKIQQVVLDGQSKDINFVTIPRVDRCQTCHQAADQAGFEDVPQPFTSHPRPELYLTGKSPHPLEKVGCTVCHRGLDRATGFVDAAHWPDSPDEQARWEGGQSWRPKEHEIQPMLPARYIEASCLPCHQSVVHIPGAERWNQGRDIIERFGCYGCHKLKGFEGLRKAGPLLTRLTWKTTPQWAYTWIRNPAAFRPSTLMPRFFGLDNNSSPEDVARTNQEIRGIVAYLFEQTEPGGFPRLPGRGDPARGEELVTSVGCLGCHAISRLEKTPPDFRRRFGPNLDGIGSKARPEWIYAWVREPRKYFPETRMPDLRLTDREALDVTAYLETLTVDGWKSEIAPGDPGLLDHLVADQLRARMTAEEVKAKVASMSSPEKEVYLGQRMITRYGCFGCHLIQGFESTPPIGTELSEEGSKEVDRFDFGFVDLPETRHDWIRQKLENPRIFDRGKVKTPDEKLKMPLFNFTPEERAAVITVILSMVKDKPPLASTHLLDARHKTLEAGRRLVQEHNCRGCHLLEGEGQAIRSTIARKLEANGMGAEEADAQAVAFSPPLITGEGARVRSDWLFHFLKGPSPIRPWLQARMPTFGFTDQEANTLIQYFSALSESPFPFETPPAPLPTSQELALARTLASKDYFNCTSCHQQGAQKPEGDPSGWAPDFALARQRLRPDWIINWIKNPQKLFPGTKMPTFYDPDNYSTSGPDDVLGGDEDRQIRALRDYLLSLGGNQAGS